jgi:thiol-disulfide isomerase/thioredoxin
VLAAFLVWQGWQGNAGPSAIAWIGTLTTFQLLALIGGLVLLGLLASQWWFLLHLLRQNGRLLVRLEAIETTVATGGRIAPSQNGKTALPQEGLPVGTRAPSFTLEGLYGETLTLDSLRSSGKPVMLLFTDPSCGPCNALLPEIEGWQQEHSEKITLALISRGNLKENKAKTSGHGLTKVLLQKDWEVSEAYEVRGTPSALVVRPDGTIGSPVVGGVEAIRSLVQQAGEGLSPNAPLLPGALAPAHKGNGGHCLNCGKKHPAEAVPARPQTIGIGGETPEVKLEDLSGKEIDLKNDFKGEETLVLFWNPGCGFCQQMLPDLKEWEENPPKGAPNLLVISAGTKEANVVMGLSSPVVLDQQFYVGRSFGVDGTPSAVLVDEDGRIASEAAVGGPAVLELASARRVGP